MDHDAVASMIHTASIELRDSGHDVDGVVFTVDEVVRDCHDPAVVDHRAAREVEVCRPEAKRDLMRNLTGKGRLTADDAAFV
jgi:hypothetical protein